MVEERQWLGMTNSVWWDPAGCQERYKGHPQLWG